MLQRVTKHLANLCQKSPAVARQFIKEERPQEEEEEPPGRPDPLLEEDNTFCRGLVHKYSNRILALLTLDCAAYCRFCTRQRKVGDPTQASVTVKDVNRMIAYVRLHPEIREVIFSGGDPLTVPDLLEYAMASFSALEQVKVMRVGTRLPVADPKRINGRKLLFLRKPEQPVYVGVHFEHPDEITPETVAACKVFRKLGCILYSQSVFLKGVNDDFETLYALFTRLIEIGVKPYYLYRCDPVRGAESFIVEFEREVEIMTRLRSALSGMACPTYVIDTPNGAGKVPVPLGFWQFDRSCFTDFNSAPIQVEANGARIGGIS
jgi:lysine 2,3-aminomutase